MNGLICGVSKAPELTGTDRVGSVRSPWSLGASLGSCVTSYCKTLPGVVSLFCYSYAVGRMSDLTTIEVSVRTRDALRELAEREGLSFNAQIEKLVRRERRRVIGSQLASAAPDAEDAALLDASASDVADASR